MTRLPGAAVALTLAAVPPVTSRAQPASGDSTNHVANVWLVASGSRPWSSRFAVYAEAQLRRTEGVTAPRQLLLRPGVLYTWTDAVTLGGGYTYVRTSPHGILSEPIVVPEHRAWEQVEIETTAGSVTLEHRVRLEHRWEADVEDVPGAPPRRAGWAYSNRARYQFRATRPLHGARAGAAGWYVSVAAEPFVRFGGAAEGRAFEQSRAYVGIGSRRANDVRVEGGYLHQYNVPERGRARETSHTLQLAVYW